MTGSRPIVADDGVVALVELTEAEIDDLLARSPQPFDSDPDDRPMPLAVPRHRVGLTLLATGELLGWMSWRPVPHIAEVAGLGWNQGFYLLPTTQGRGLSSRGGILLARHLFALSGANRVQALTDPDNLPARRGLEGAGFQLEGPVRGIMRRGGRHRDMVSYSLLRSDLAAMDAAAAGEREVLARRDGLLLARAVPADRRAVAAVADGAFAVDQDRRPPPGRSRTPERAAVLDADTGELLGLVGWRAAEHGPAFGSTAWTIDADLAPAARDRAAAVRRLVAEHLFATTELDRVEAGVDEADREAREALEKAGYQLDGLVRGALLRGGVRRDLALYGVLRTDLTDPAEPTVHP